MSAWDYLTKLSEWPHRGAGSENEKMCAKWLVQQGKDTGYFVTEQKFNAPTDTLYKLPIFLIALVLLLTWLPLWFDVPIGISLALFALALIPLWFEASGSYRTFPFSTHKPSQNVLYSPSRSNLRKKIVVVAHYDTQLGSILFHPSIVAYLRYIFLLTYSLVAINFLGLIYLLISSPLWLLNLLSISSSLLLVILILFMVAFLTGRYTNGANDNGSGTALALSLAKEFKDEDIPVDLHFLFTGSEEAGTVGMKAFLKEYSHDFSKEDTLFINLDNLGTPMLTTLAGEGLLKVIPYSKYLVEKANLVSQEVNIPLQIRGNLLLPTDSLPLIANGWQAITFLGMDTKGQLGNYHWHTDTINGIDREFLSNLETYFAQYLRELAMESSQEDS